MRSIFSSIICSLFLIQSIQFAEARELSAVSLSLPDLKWALEIAMPDLKLEKTGIATYGEAARLYATVPETGMAVSAFLEIAPREGGPGESRAYYWSRGINNQLKIEKFKQYELGDMAIVDYLVPEYQGVQINQRNIKAYLAKDHYWMGVYISKTNYAPKDDLLFKEALHSINILNNYSPSSFDYFNYGTLFYRQNKYSTAIPHFEKALAIEKKTPALGEDLFKALIDALGVAYGVSGELDKEKELFTWAISQYPQFPMFYYNLACAYAESGDLNRAIENLQKAYTYKDRMLPGETFPDPRSDPSFEIYLKNKTFVTELKKME